MQVHSLRSLFLLLKMVRFQSPSYSSVRFLLRAVTFLSSEFIRASLSALLFLQCITSTLEDESQALNMAQAPSAPVSLPCISLTEKELLFISRSLLRRTSPTSTPTSITQMTPLRHTKPPSTRTPSSTWTSVGNALLLLFHRINV